MVEEHPVRAEGELEGDLDCTGENVGMSSESQVRILATENLRIPEEGSSTQG